MRFSTDTPLRAVALTHAYSGRHLFRRLLHLFIVLAISRGLTSMAMAQPNLLANGSFEVDPNGTAYANLASTSGWRWFSVGGATGSATVRAAAAHHGAVGMELVREIVGTGDTALDKDADRTQIPPTPRVYQFLLDARDGGIYGGTSGLYMGMQYGTTYPAVQFDPGLAYETYGLNSISDSSGQLAVRVSNTADNASVYLDHLRVYDVTDANRVLNGGFEHSTSRLINWRHFSLVGGEFLATLETAPANVFAGAQALRLERTGSVSDGAVDLDGDKIPVRGGESLIISVAARKISGDAATRLQISVPEYDAAQTFIGYQTLIIVNPGAGYETFSRQITVQPGTAFINPGLRIADNVGGDRHIGAFFVDDFEVIRTDNLLSNGDFEAQSEGDANGTVPYWRLPWPANVGITATAAAAAQGRMGAQIATSTNAGFWIDRWDPANLATPISKPGVYQLLADFKNGGVHGSQDSVSLGLLLHGAPYPMVLTTLSPSASFETFGVGSWFAADRTALDVRLTPSNTSNQSFLVDNIRVLDVTRRNRLINGGFENSATRLTNWRAYSLNPGEFLYALDGEANSGSRALRIERTYAGAGDNDAAVDIDSDRVPAVGGELLRLSCAAKKLSGDANTRLSVIVAHYDGATLVDLNILSFQPGSSYTAFEAPVTVHAAATSLNVSFRVGDDAGADRHIGAYLVDDVAMMRNQPPSFTGAALLENAPAHTVLNAQSSGWSDADGDPARFTYQWKLNGVDIPGATGPVLDSSVYGPVGLVTCLVTAYDGVLLGNSIETAPISVPVALSTFSVD